MLAKPSSRPKAGPDLQAFPRNEPDLALRLEMKIGYRNIKAGSCFEFPYGVNLITGDRVSGKTSLLQAISCPTEWKLFPSDWLAKQRVLTVDRPEDWSIQHLDFYADHPSRLKDPVPPRKALASLFESQQSHGEIVRDCMSLSLLSGL